MKRMLVFLIIPAICWQMKAQVTAFSGTNLRDLNGNLVSLSSMVKQGSPLVLVFWKSGNSKCCENLETIQSAWMSNLKEQGVNFIAICEDCSGTWAHVKPFVNAKEWDFDVFIDVNGDLKRELGVTSIPTTLLYGKEMDLLCRHAGWCAGNEEMLCKKILDHLNIKGAPVPSK